MIDKHLNSKTWNCCFPTRSLDGALTDEGLPAMPTRLFSRTIARKGADHYSVISKAISIVLIQRAHICVGCLCASLLATAALDCRVAEAAAAPAQAQSRVAELKKMSVEDLMRVEVTTVSRQESTIGRSPATFFFTLPKHEEHYGN